MLVAIDREAELAFLDALKELWDAEEFERRMLGESWDEDVWVRLADARSRSHDRRAALTASLKLTETDEFSALDALRLRDDLDYLHARYA